MKDAAPQTIYLSDYRPFGYLVDDVHLTFRLAETATRVISRISFRPNSEFPGAFFLHGQDVTLIWAKINGEDVTSAITDDGLTCDVPDGPFVWEAEVEISPATNTALEGLYTSGGMYCTQCEAEGFRKITYYPDRPDVMSVFTVRIEGDHPVMLSNGNPVASSEGWAEWHDPWPKPAYLFALVAGDLVAHSGTFKTMSGNDVELNIFVRPGPDKDKCAFGMEALKRSMKWDEDVYGREYDLDIFNIVAVDDFNMGAMENKGLNIFNSSCVLASPETSTDANFERIDAIIAHEYFHNWTGNRITCRDWFQLCLKEGLTVFRDQQYTGDQGSHAVKRIEDAITLRSRQFREDGGPLAHPVRPESFIEINNFYTITVYEKGAELIGMLKRLVGDEDYYKALDLYFSRHDGDAATIEDWLKVFEDSTGRDLSQFKRWYSQAGTPRLTVSDSYEDDTYTLHFTQETPPTPGQNDKDPMVIPIAVGLLSQNGDEVQPTTVLEMTQASQSFSFDGLAGKPVPSVLRDFSAPVILQRDQTNAERAFLMAHDTDPFNKWDAGEALARAVYKKAVTEGAAPDKAYLDGIAAILRDDTLDPAFRALVLTLPSEGDMAQVLFDAGVTPDPIAIHHAGEALRVAMAQHVQDILPRIYADCMNTGPFSPDAKSAGKRSLGNTALGLITRLDGGAAAAKQFADADNMTLQLGGLAALLRNGTGEKESAAFRTQWRSDRLVMDKWFGLTVSAAGPDAAASTAQKLTEEPDFDMKNPNRFRAVFGALAGHAAGFHAADGSAYRLLGDWLKKLDAINPQTTARMSTAFETWRRYDADRQAQIRAVLQDIAGTAGLSRDTSEMVGRMLE
ncbi:aminopeptidase N [Octadecabacter sp. 1_MG-2023]|uniref:aminopeptidase N n=1 Tax=unclassified Octadecabacter TaxID=196158 RepID=UPI001C08E804|nr:MULTISPECIES: aminopeptidase N [unclassified Octadecabacter]MBU2992964.1 aminopeptidase N [Octadecabacter sp. B2R22]MDO6733584.1 aminopeptidase N [Octadecabacter sp. 1_MG-2023]